MRGSSGGRSDAHLSVTRPATGERSSGPRANVLIVDDDDALRRALADRIRFWGHDTATASTGEEALLAVRKKAYDLVFLDLAMPGMGGMAALEKLKEQNCDADVVVLTAHGSVEKAVEAMQRGAADFLTKPADFDLLQRVVTRALETRRLRRVNRALAAHIEDGSPAVVGQTDAMRELMETAARAAASDSTLLLIGESGTGKQVLAEYIHRHSPRHAGPFVYVNCVAISDELIESTLFGHEKGAFTGAVSRKEGRLESAQGGTAFLDEIGDVSPRLQTKLLHFLESGEFERVGGTQTVAVDCRVLAATNRNLQEEVRAGRFREDLYYRINVITMHLPPLRERAGDIPVLASAFLARFGRELKREQLAFAPRTLEILQGYSWPGNVRQLKNAVERMAVLARTEVLTPDLLPPEIRDRPCEESSEMLDLPYREALVRFKKRLIARALARVGGNQTRAAEELGVQRTYLNRLIKELDIGE